MQKQLLIDVTDMQVDGHGVVRIPPDVTLYDIDIDSTVTRGASI